MMEKQYNSTEAFFGLNNPLVTALDNELSSMRRIVFAETETNPYAKNSDIVKKIKTNTDNIARIIEADFNIEKCNIGWTSANNFYSVGNLFNKELYNNSKNYSTLRSGFNDVIESSKGYRFKNKKGIYFNIVLSIRVIKNQDFSNREIIGLIMHEIGHCVATITEGLDMYIINNYLGMILSGDLELDSASKKQALIDEMRNAVGDEESEREMAEYLLSNTNIDDKYLNFSKLKGSDLTGLVSLKEGNLDKPNKIQFIKKPSIIQTIIGKIKNFFYTVFVIPFLIPTLKKRAKLISSYNSGNSAKYREESIADNLANAYGVSVELSTALKKMMNSDKTYSPEYNIEKNSSMDVMQQYKELENDFICAASGYPSNPKRVANNYAACKYELDNNKDLTSEQKKEILEMMNRLKSLYTDYVLDASNKGKLYKSYQAICRQSIEEESAKDPQFKKFILDPLKQRSDKYYKQ